jgi:hypothetical protein
VTKEVFDVYLANAVGYQATTEEEVVEVVRGIRAGVSPPHRAAPERATKLLGNFKTDAFEAVSQRVETALDEAGQGHSFDEVAFRGQDVRRRVVQSVKNRVRPLVPQRFLRETSGPRWVRMFTQMYYGLDSSDVTQKVGVASRMLKKDVKARFHGRDLVLIEGE